MRYLVRWEIDIEAETPEQAAAEALRIQRSPNSIATVFDISWRGGRAWPAAGSSHVHRKRIDLTPIDPVEQLYNDPNDPLAI